LQFQQRKETMKELNFMFYSAKKASHIVRNSFTCPWGGEFDVGDHVIAGIYY
jgi:hypothetical protein